MKTNNGIVLMAFAITILAVIDLIRFAPIVLLALGCLSAYRSILTILLVIGFRSSASDIKNTDHNEQNSKNGPTP